MDTSWIHACYGNLLFCYSPGMWKSVALNSNDKSINKLTWTSAPIMYQWRIITIYQFITNSFKNCLCWSAHFRLPLNDYTFWKLKRYQVIIIFDSSIVNTYTHTLSLSLSLYIYIYIYCTYGFVNTLLRYPKPCFNNIHPIACAFHTHKAKPWNSDVHQHSTITILSV